MEDTIDEKALAEGLAGPKTEELWQAMTDLCGAPPVLQWHGDAWTVAPRCSQRGEDVPNGPIVGLGESIQEAARHAWKRMTEQPEGAYLSADRRNVRWQGGLVGFKAVRGKRKAKAEGSEA